MIDGVCEKIRAMGDEDPVSFFLKREVLYLFQSPTVAQEVGRIMNKNAQDLTLSDLQVAFRVGSRIRFPPSLLAQMMTDRVRKCRERQQRFERMTDGYKHELFLLLATEAAAGRIPVTPALLRQRLQGVQIHLIDEVERYSTSAGFCSPYGVIGISDEQFQSLPEEELRTLVYHELLHEVSGKVITLTEANAGSLPRTREKKSGLRLMGEDPQTKRFSWLDEAITEWYALELSQKHAAAPLASTSYSYKEERDVLDDLMRRGLSRDVVLGAYFENIDGRVSTGSHGAYFARLIKEAQRVTGDPAIMSKLENRFLLRDMTREVPWRLYSEEELGNLAYTLPDTSVYRVTLVAGKSMGSQMQDVGYLLRWSHKERVQEIETLLEAGIRRSGGRLRYTVDGSLSIDEVLRDRSSREGASLERAA